MKKILLYILVSTLCSQFGWSQASPGSIVNYSDTVLLGQPIDLITSSTVINNGPPPLLCSPLCSVTDTLINNEIILDLTFDFAGGWNTGCIRMDSIQLYGYNQGNYIINCNWFVKYSSIPGSIPTIIASDTIQVVVLNSTNIPKYETESFSISPNPAKNFVNINGLQKGLQKIEMFSLSGKKVREFNRSQQKHSLEGLDNGIYFIQITTENSIITKKLMIAR